MNKRCGGILGLPFEGVMYPYDDRTRAVKLHILLGERIAATIRQLGYPTKNLFKNWHEEYSRDLNLPAGYALPSGVNTTRNNLFGVIAVNQMHANEWINR